ncbi:hypothetical protein N0V90_007708 [Kalmusia sp. IMI 367209]|nr:hypothetical protein N0V90_007708 [Kalmusia sp. IMI 367209]
MYDRFSACKFVDRENQILKDPDVDEVRNLYKDEVDRRPMSSRVRERRVYLLVDEQVVEEQTESIEHLNYVLWIKHMEVEYVASDQVFKNLRTVLWVDQNGDGQCAAVVKFIGAEMTVGNCTTSCPRVAYGDLGKIMGNSDMFWLNIAVQETEVLADHFLTPNPGTCYDNPFVPLHFYFTPMPECE